MEVVENIKNLNVTETTKEEKTIFKSYCLADHTFNGIMEKYDSYCFHDYIYNIRIASYSSITVDIIFLFKGVEKKINLFNSVIQIANYADFDEKTFYCEDEEENKKTIDNFLTTRSYDVAFIEAEMNTKYYKNLILINNDFEDEDEYINDNYSEDDGEDDSDYEEEEVDYLPTLELPFFQDKCVVCLDNKPSILILPCMHVCHCILCDEEGLFKKCPMCRENIERKITINNKK